jgi:hypothetical protein
MEFPIPCVVKGCINLACPRDNCGKQGNALFYCGLHILNCVACNCALSPVPYGAVRAVCMYGVVYMCKRDANLMVRLFVTVGRLPLDVKRLILLALKDAKTGNKRVKRS